MRVGRDPDPSWFETVLAFVGEASRMVLLFVIGIAAMWFTMLAVFTAAEFLRGN